MKKLIIALLFVPAVAWADTSTTDVYVPPSNEASVNEIIAAVKKVPELEKRIEALEKRAKQVENAPRIYFDEEGKTVPEEFKKYLEQYTGDLILVPNKGGENGR